MNETAIFSDPSMVMFGKILLALLLGATIGTERSVVARQAAGMRTFGLVALGSCLLIIMSNHIDTAYLGILNFDPMRLAAGIFTGIGFLGGGVLFCCGDALPCG